MLSPSSIPSHSQLSSTSPLERISRRPASACCISPAVGLKIWHTSTPQINVEHPILELHRSSRTNGVCPIFAHNCSAMFFKENLLCCMPRLIHCDGRCDSPGALCCKQVTFASW